jgi:hypothetical protein
VFTLSRSRNGEYFVPELIRITGISEGDWELKRDIWHGDCDRERVGPPRKKVKTKRDGSGGGSDEEGAMED